MKTIYEQLGDERLVELVHEFYDRVFASEKIRPLFQTDPDEIRRKQLLFLTQFLGGPALYSTEYGHPRMRARHLPHQITQEAREEWLRCMKEAIGTLEVDQQLKEELYNCFPQLARHMVNS